MTSPHSPESQLIVAAVRGRAAARAELIRRLRPVVRARVRRRVGPTEDIDDLCQEVWLHLFEDEGRRLRAFEPQLGGTLEGFVGRIAERRVVDLLRERGAQRRGGHLRAVSGPELDETEASGMSDPSELVHTAELADKLGDYLSAELPERGRLVLQLLFKDGLSPQDVARTLNVKVQVVYNSQHRIRNEARRYIEAQELTPVPAARAPRIP